jgi:hypothetical protein
MLHGLDQVEWGRLRHAYGPAEDIPRLIRALASRLPDERRAAWRELYGNLWHQGTVYEATPHAVPFLIELAASDETHDRFEILSYLGTLADGSSYIDRHKGVVKLSQVELAEQLETERKWVAQTRKAVKCGEALYLAALRADEHKICCAAGYVLSRFPEAGERYWIPLRMRYEEADNDELVRCGIAILTKQFSAQGTSDTSWLAHMFEQERRRPVRIALAVSISLSDAAHQDDALELLTAHLLSDDGIEAGYHTQPWDSGEAVWDIVQALCASKTGRRMLVRRFNELLSQDAPPSEGLKYCRYLLQGHLSQGVLSDETIDSSFFNGPLRPLPLWND